MAKIRQCVKCGGDYELTPKKLGFINECGTCGAESDQHTERLGGNMIYSHKTAATIEIKSLAKAQTFAKLGRRNGGQCVLSNLVERKS